MIGLIAFLACGPKNAPIESTVETRTYNQKPSPLEAPTFELPQLTAGELSNGIPVFVAENHETPLVTVQMVFGTGIWNSSNPQLAVAALDMLTEGAGNMDSAGLSAAQRALAADIYASSNLDGSMVTLSSLKKNLSDSVALFSTVIQNPTYPDKEWGILQKQYVQEFQNKQKDPSEIVNTVFDGLMYNGQYKGRATTLADINTLNTTMLKTWHQENLVAQHAQIIVGGDCTLEEILPILEANFAQMAKTQNALPALPTAKILPETQATQIYLIDKPGASQSTIYAGQFVPERTDEISSDLYLANMAIGGLFIARINMNLREDKGWTYGARSSIRYNYLPGLWTVYTSVVSEHTADALGEILKELRESQADRPILQEELDASLGYLLGTEPLRYEQPDYLLSQMVNINRYNLPADYYQNQTARLRSVTLESAQEAWNSYIDPEHLRIVIVGDSASILAPLENLGLVVTPVDATGKPL